MPPKWLKYIQELKKVSEARKTATPLVKYYGPTMGKTTAAKYNPLLVDFDDIIRQPSKDILKKYGFDSKFHMFESGNQDALKEYQDMLVSQMQAFKSNPSNVGKTLVVSPSPVVNPKITGFQFDNVPSIPSKEEFVRRNVSRGGTESDSIDWWENLMKRNPDLKIDDRYISDIEYSLPEYINLDQLSQIAQDSEKYWKYLKPGQRQVIKSLFDVKLPRNYYLNSKMDISGYNNTISSIEKALEDAKGAYKRVIDAQNAVLPKTFTTPVQVKPIVYPHNKSIQSIIDSDFTPFDEMPTLFQTGSKAKTTMNFKLSDYYKQGGILKAQKGKVLKSLEELKELAEPLKRSISGETTLTKNGRRAFRVAKPSTKPAVYTKTFVVPIAAKPVELKITEIPSLKTPQEILAFDPSAYMNALTSAQNASAMGLSDLSKLLYKDASWLNPQKDALKSKFLWGELYRDGGIIKSIF